MTLPFQKISGGVCSPSGFQASAAFAGIKPTNVGRNDVALVASDCDCVAAATFTKNLVKAAPVLVSMQRVKSKATRAVLLNSGNANACTGPAGVTAAKASTQSVAKALGISDSEILVCSTGRIGVPFPSEKITSIAPSLVANLARSKTSGSAAAQAIMTSDSVHKECAVEIQGSDIRIGGMAKGAGMIDPNMATMLAVITTDAALTKTQAKSLLKAAVEQSFNLLTIDGDMSTNDTVILLANGIAGTPEDLEAFEQALNFVTLDLAKKIVADGEGVSRFIELCVTGARTKKDARLAAEAIAKSQLVKCAWAGGDPNWGRILDAAGYSGAKFDPNHVSITYNDLIVAQSGMAAPTPIAQIEKIAAKKQFTVKVDLAAGSQSHTVFTTDLTEDYVRLNLAE